MFEEEQRRIDQEEQENQLKIQVIIQSFVKDRKDSKLSDFESLNDSFEDDKSSKAKSYNSEKKSKFYARNLLKATTCGLKSEPLIPDRKTAYENEVKFIETLANHKY